MWSYPNFLKLMLFISYTYCCHCDKDYLKGETDDSAHPRYKKLSVFDKYYLNRPSAFMSGLVSPERQELLNGIYASSSKLTNTKNSEDNENIVMGKTTQNEKHKIDNIKNAITDIRVKSHAPNDTSVFDVSDTSLSKIHDAAHVLLKRSTEPNEEQTEVAVTKISNETISDKIIIIEEDEEKMGKNIIEEIEQEKSRQEETDHDAPVRCDQFQRSRPFDLKKMADVWKIVYHTIPQRLTCFKLYIKLLTQEEKQQYLTKYGSFNDTVDWNACNLEVRSNDINGGVRRKHFLQGTKLDMGVMENVIMEEDRISSSTTVTYHRETPDQWLVVKNLLLMRDCSTGDLVVFSRVPSVPNTNDVAAALHQFGESPDLNNGTWACKNPVYAWTNTFAR